VRERPAKPDKTAAIITATKPMKLVRVSEAADEEEGNCVTVTPTVRRTREPHLEGVRVIEGEEGLTVRGRASSVRAAQRRRQWSGSLSARVRDCREEERGRGVDLIADLIGGGIQMC
jgi:hypothetical protein